MARQLNGTTSHISDSVYTGPLGYPFTVSFWFNPDVLTANMDGFSFGDSGVSDEHFRCLSRGAITGDPASFSVTTAGATYHAGTANSCNAGAWNHFLGSTSAGNSRATILNGDTANAGSSTTSTTVNFANYDLIDVGRHASLVPAGYYDGGVAEVAIWDVDLSAGEKAALALGLSPLSIRPASIIWYRAFVRTLDGGIGGGTLTSVSTTVSAHPRIFLPSAQILQFPTPAAAGGAGTPISYLHRNQFRHILVR